MLEAQRRGIPLFRFNTEDYPANIGLDYDPLAASSARILGIDGPVAIGRARGIWLRRPRWPELSTDVTDPIDRLFGRQEAVGAIGGLWRLLADRCVSPPDALQAARWKIPQLQLAHDLGMLVPTTLVTTDPRVAARFAAREPRVLKAIGQAAVRLGDLERIGHTVELEPGFASDLVRLAPVLIQARVEKRADVRITVVGRRVFPVRIVTPAGAPLDFRVSRPDECTYSIPRLDPNFEGMLLAFLRHWPLHYGAFDFAEDRDGQLWFLECNPGGQWGWLEQPTGLRITEALVDLLLAPSGS